ncbi:KRAB-A domain-containing protein 2 [Plakobranchus ocellatus]|uniref:KRAB-A domain-containing protein 2 n=1 Tax=Plakobranchus ocellatus TaxID=259542 RepID=A0AAV4BZ90_9GAST|nr:KRAB-A domain-containing protein 2 [Plakobranchus ocellatus]
MITSNGIISGIFKVRGCEILQCGPTEKTLDTTEWPLYYVSIEQAFDVVKSAYISTDRGKGTVCLKELQKKYANIPTKAVELFKSLFQDCQRKRKWLMTNGQYSPRNSRQEVSVSN